MWSGLSYLLASEAGDAVRRHVRAALFLAVGLLAGLIGIVFGLLALHTWLLSRMSSIEASLLIAAGLAVVSIVFIVVALMVRKARRQASGMTSTAIVAAPLALKMLAGRSQIKTLGVIGVVALGAMLGRQLGRMR